MKKCLIYLDNSQIQNSLDLLEVAKQIYFGEEYKTVGVVFNTDFRMDYKVFDRIIYVKHPKIKNYDQVAITDVMAELQNKNNFDSILIPGTPFGRMLAPRLAMQLHTGLVADVTRIKKSDEGLEIIRPAFSGRIMAGIKCIGDGPIMMSVRQNVFNYEQKNDKDTETEIYEPKSINDGGIRCLSVKSKEEVYDIRESDVLISGGGGVIKNFDTLKSLADLLGGQVSASRKIVDKGIAPRSIQVGQSGKTVSPKLYIALGIYGAIQHVEGLKQIENIISVNTNKDAPICSLSDIVVEGDAVVFIEKLIKRIKESI